MVMMHVKVLQHFDLVCFNIFVGFVVSHSVQPMDLDKFQWITLTTIWCISSQACQGHCNLSRCTFCIMVISNFYLLETSRNWSSELARQGASKISGGPTLPRAFLLKNCSWCSHLFMFSFVLPLFFLFLSNFCVTHLTTYTPSLLPAAFPCTPTNTAIFVMEAPYKTS